MRKAAMVLALLVLTGCQSDDPAPDGSDFPARTPIASPTSEDSLLIGLVGTLSGPDEWRGEDAFEGAEPAINQINRGRGDAPRIELITRDDRGDRDRAVQLLRELAANDRVIGIVYAGPSDALSSVEADLARSGIPAFLTIGDLYLERQLSPHVFQMSPSYLWGARRIAAYLLRDRRYEDVGAIVGRGPSRVALQTAFGEEGARIKRFAADNQNVRDNLRFLKRSRVEAIVVDASPRRTAEMVETLRSMGSLYRGTGRARIASARTAKLARRHARGWRPQIVTFDLGMSRAVADADPPPGTVAADTYARGSSYLPVPSLERFDAAFRRWWDGEAPSGWELRSYDAVRALGWALDRGGNDLAKTLEGLERARFGGLPITFGPDDHTAVDQTTVGLWAVPRPSVRNGLRERDELVLPWVMLHRGFTIDGEHTMVLNRDWKYLFAGRTFPKGPAPKLKRARFGITTARKDPIH